MASQNFNFETFAADHQLTNWVANLSDIIASDERFREKIKDFKEKFRLQGSEDRPPSFSFLLADQSYEDVVKKCNEEKKNLKKVSFVQADRIYVSENLKEEPPQVWNPVATEASVDLHHESSQLVFFDSEKRLVNWEATLSNLREMMISRPYNEKMAKSCLIRFINHYLPGQTEFLKEKSANEIANFLITLDARVDKIAYYKQMLLTSSREPAESLQAAVFKLKNIVDKIYPPTAGDSENPGSSMANRILINAVISFVRDEIAIPLLNRVLNDNSMSRLLSYSEYLKMAANAEIRSQIFPTSALRYNRKLNTGVNPVMQLNNITIPNIHPSMDIPKRRGFMQHDLNRLLGFTSPVEDNYSPVKGSYGDFFSPPGQDLTPHLASPAGPFGSIAPGFDSSINPQSSASALPALPQRNNTLPVRKIVSKGDVPPGSTLFSSPQGQFFYLNDEKIYVEQVEAPNGRSEGTAPDPQTPHASNSASVPEPIPPSRDSSSPETENIYEQVKLMSAKLQQVLDVSAQALKGAIPRSGTRERSRSYSKDGNKPQNSSYQSNETKRDNRGPSAGKIYSDYRSNSQSRGNSTDRGRRTEYRSDSQNRGRYEKPRSNSRDRHYSDDSKRGEKKDNYSQRGYDSYRSNSKDRNQSDRSNDDDWKRGRQRTRSPTPYDRRQVSRDRSREARRFEYLERLYPNMRRGYNCSSNYNPQVKKYCGKCPNSSAHHEFECPNYDRYSDQKCKVCDRYFHIASSCKEIPKFPPKSADSQNVSPFLN
jgi:hypothetical protein